jgi:2-amino-4-hydroxy-6-hydroxymethyldihydropteridine diphosphokinase
MRKAMLNVVSRSNSTLVSTSPVYQTEPWGKGDQEWFYNAVLRIRTTASPEELLQYCRQTEAALGSEVKERWGPRKIDLDILFYGEPLADIAPGFIHPVLGKNIKTLLRECADDKEVRKLDDRL